MTAETLATQHDERHLMRAVELAAEARGRTSPNPLVGAVVVKNGRTIGEGFHHAAGQPHAEREALTACSEDPAGATMYVSLEPCCHHGRTPPCTEAIVGARIARVVIASDDPSGKASGRGLGILRDEGVAVEMMNGQAGAAARLLNQPFRKHARTGRPLVVWKAAMTLDGKVATGRGDSKWISSDASRARAHRWRAEADAVACGIGTALADDPLLTARIEGVERQPARVVFDSEARLPLTSKLVQTARDVPLYVMCSRAAKRTATEALSAAGAEIVVVRGDTDAARISDALRELGAREIQSLLLEGGPHLAGSFFDASEVDEARVFIAPILAGGARSRPALDGQGVELIGDAPRAIEQRVETIDGDVLIEARFREW
ncbi:MAG: diaminohydroxyphosphoribosylaminopyrimidine deaminase [Thermoleophilaceae bacterium]|nr:diaminohydroxyphosphoribosylaminopyrimidine deaminase [Thermoleophilaceae bacterium]